MSKILVVDDDPDILTVIKTVLTLKGFEVAVTNRGDEVFKKINTFKPDILLLDVLLSGLDGRDICKKVKSNPESKNIPVLMLSAHPAAASNICDYGADGFINKPFKVSDLLTEINKRFGTRN